MKKLSKKDKNKDNMNGWMYLCNCSVHKLSDKHHNQIQKGTHQHRCPDCKEVMTFGGNMRTKAEQEVRNMLFGIAVRKGYCSIYSGYDKIESALQQVVDDDFTIKRKKK